MLNRKKASSEPAPEEKTVTPDIDEEEGTAIPEADDLNADAAGEPQPPAGEPADEPDPVVKELEQAKENYLRLAAEYENYRKRTQREKEALAGDVKASTVTELLPIIDNLERALSYEGADESDIRKGIEMVRVQAVNIFDKLGITQFCEPGDAFDPNIHNCIGIAAVDGFESGQITLVIQKGYMLGDKVIRPAMVQVAE